jgi:hypothetical protein
MKAGTLQSIACDKPQSHMNSVSTACMSASMKLLTCTSSFHCFDVAWHVT